MARIGIMQGRMVPPVRGIQAFPRDNWREEFPAAAAAGLDFIEWIFDGYGEDVNPLMSAAGLQELQALIAQTGVGIESVCADYFMEKPLLKCSDQEQAERLAMLQYILQQSKQLGVNRIVLPFVDASAIEDGDEEAAFVALMRDVILPTAEMFGIEMHLETSLPPQGVARVLAQLEHPLFWINYDSGNSASLGYKPADEFAAYGARIGSFHVKDRVLGGTTVPLATGHTDFVALKHALADVGYTRSYVLQVARGEAGHEIPWAAANRTFTEMHVIPEA